MDKLIRITASVAVLAVAVIAAIISYQHACELIRAHGKAGATAWLLPLTVDGLILERADAASAHHAWPAIASAAQIGATIGANWHTASVTDPSVPWSARGPRSPWLALTNCQCSSSAVSMAPAATSGQSYSAPARADFGARGTTRAKLRADYPGAAPRRP